MAVGGSSWPCWRLGTAVIVSSSMALYSRGPQDDVPFLLGLAAADPDPPRPSSDDFSLPPSTWLGGTDPPGAKFIAFFPRQVRSRRRSTAEPGVEWLVGVSRQINWIQCINLFESSFDRWHRTPDRLRQGVGDFYRFGETFTAGGRLPLPR